MILRTHPDPGTRYSDRRRGLSLMEVLMSLAIFLMSLVALSQLIDMGSERARDMQWLSYASTIAQSNMDKLVAGLLPLAGQAEQASEEDADWQVAVDAGAEGNIPALFLVTVTVSRTRTDGSRFETKLTQFVLDPAQRGSTTGTDDSSADTTGSGGTTTGGGQP